MSILRVRAAVHAFLSDYEEGICKPLQADIDVFQKEVTFHKNLGRTTEATASQNKLAAAQEQLKGLIPPAQRLQSLESKLISARRAWEETTWASTVANEALYAASDWADICEEAEVKADAEHKKILEEIRTQQMR